jgi:hypothetical protein
MTDHRNGEDRLLPAPGTAPQSDKVKKNLDSPRFSGMMSLHTRPDVRPARFANLIPHRGAPMNIRDPNDRESSPGNVAAPSDDVQPEWLFDTSAGCDPIFFDTSAHIEAATGGASWEAYRRHGYSVWRFDGQGWQVVTSKCAAGAVCGAPPREAGQFVGELRKKHCEPAVES